MNDEIIVIKFHLQYYHNHCRILYYKFFDGRALVCVKKHEIMFDIHQTTTSLQQIDNLNPRTICYPALDESCRMKSTYFTIHLGKNPPPQNSCRLKSVFL